MSDLTRFRKRLRNVERSGYHLTALIDELKAEIAEQGVGPTRSQEQRMIWLAKIRDERRLEYLQVRDKLRAEERRLISDPNGFLRFT